MKHLLQSNGIKKSLISSLIALIGIWVFIAFTPSSVADQAEYDACIAEGIEAPLCAFYLSEEDNARIRQQALQNKQQAEQNEANSTIQEVAEKAEFVHKIFSPLINLFSFHIGNFLNNDYIFAGDMGTMLKGIWVITRNIVNVFFVFMLLWIAIRQIFGGYLGLDDKPIGKELIKIAIFLVLVNFSWLATKVVLDASSVATMASFSIPSGVSTADSVKTNEDECSVDITDGPSKECSLAAKYGDASSDETLIFHYPQSECKDVKATYDKVYDENNNIKLTATKEEIADVAGTTSMCWKKRSTFDIGPGNILVELIHTSARIEKLTSGNISASQESEVQIKNLAVGFIFSIVIQAAYTLALLALFIVMIARMAMLWLFVAFSPALVAMGYIGGIERGSSIKFSIKDFINWSFVTAKVGIVFSVSTLMIAAGQRSEDALNRLNEINAGSANFEGKMYNLDTIFAGMETVNEIIWLLITLVVLWLGVFAVTGELPIVGNITNKIGDFGKRMAGYFAKLPYTIPAIPYTDKDGNERKASIRQLKQDLENKLDFREGAEANLGFMDDLNHRAKEIKQNENLSTEMKEALSGGNSKKLAQLFNNITPEKARDLRTSTLTDLAKTAGIEDEGEQQRFADYIKLYGKGESGNAADTKKATKPSGNNTTNTTNTSTYTERAKAVASDPTTKNELTNAIRLTNGAKIAEILKMSKEDIKTLDDNGLNQLADDAGINNPDDITKFKQGLIDHGKS